MTESFATRVGEVGKWPAPPAHWSFSTLRDVESCPLRYALRSATYTGTGFGAQGYPDKTSEAALAGIVMHGAVERVVRALRELPDPSDPVAAIGALRTLGGYPGVIETCVAEVEERLETNPRIRHRRQRMAANLRRRAPEIRSTVQGIVSRLPPPPSASATPPAGSAFRTGRKSLQPGSHPEARLRSDEKRFKGQIDLLTVNDTDADIVDFKSGANDEHHAEQVVLYGLLWLLDDVANPGRVPVGKLGIAYPGQEMSVPHPSAWEEAEVDLVARIAAADASIGHSPSARPSEACLTCSVRHMCEEYWRSGNPVANAGSFGDAEVTILSRHGALSWSARLLPTDEDALVRTTSEDVSFTVGATVRLLDVACERQATDDGGPGVAVLTAVSSSEIFELY